MSPNIDQIFQDMVSSYGNPEDLDLEAVRANLMGMPDTIETNMRRATDPGVMIGSIASSFPPEVSQRILDSYQEEAPYLEAPTIPRSYMPKPGEGMVMNSATGNAIGISSPRLRQEVLDDAPSEFQTRVGASIQQRKQANLKDLAAGKIDQYAGSLPKELAERMDLLNSTQGLEAKTSLLSSMAGEVEQQFANRAQAISSELRGKLGVNELENALQSSIQNDIATRTGQSAQTVNLQQQLDKATSSYTTAFEKARNSDPFLKGLDTYISKLTTVGNTLTKEHAKQYNDEWEMSLADPQDLMTAAMGGNRKALDYLTKVESNNVGKDPKVIEKDFADMRRVLTDPTKFMALYQQQLESMATTKEDKAQIPGRLKLMQEMATGSKEKWAASLPTRLEVANNYMKTKNTARVQGNVESWYSTTDPAANATMLELKQKSGNRPISLSEFSQAYVHEAPTKELAIQRSEDMKAYLDKEIQRINRGSFGNINPTAIYGAIAPRSVGLSEVVAGILRAPMAGLNYLSPKSDATNQIVKDYQQRGGLSGSLSSGMDWESLKQTLANIGR